VAAPLSSCEVLATTQWKLRRDRHCIWGTALCPQGASADPQRQARGPEGCNDARTGMPARILAGAMCVQRFDDSLNSAIHITYRISLRSSSMPEPRDPLLKVLTYLCFTQRSYRETEFGARGGRWPGRRGGPARAGHLRGGPLPAEATLEGFAMV
jgi:hypothetical protein